MNKSLCKLLCILTLVAIIPATVRTQEPGGGNAGTGTLNSPSPSANAAEKPKKRTGKATATASTPEIAAAQSSGKVWVNTESGVYHKQGRWYGKTREGKFMTESDARKAGYQEAKKE